ncbi:MAG: hypothetical protein KAS32_05585 [Candidatus Peribacteraceae bacterium]|nr:hypothetical protein [Candidatus Peribacteraceae bacterium]
MFEQIVIAITGVVALWLANDHRDGKRKYACLFGLAGQPFWFYSAFIDEQWGVFVLAFFCTGAWFKGFRYHWLQKEASII